MSGKDSRIINTLLCNKAFRRSSWLFSAGLIFFILFFPRTADAQTISFRASQRTIGKGDSTALKWDVRKAGRKDSITISGLDGKFGLKGELTVAPDQTTQYVLMIRHRGRIAKKSLRVNVVEPEILFFNGSDTLLHGENGRLSWRTRYARQIEIVNEHTFLPEAGSVLIMPMAPVTYTLRACNNNYCITAQHTVNVQGDYVRGPSVLRNGESGELEWRFENALSVKLDDGDELLPAEGSITISPQTSTTYRFIVKKESDSPIQTATVRTITVPVVGTRFLTGSLNYLNLPSGRRVIFDIISVNWHKFPEEISFRVLIMDTLGNYITGMAPPHISEQEARGFFVSVIETIDSTRYPIHDMKIEEVRTMTSLPNDIVLVLDYSGSMSKSFGSLDLATRHFINRKHPSDRLGIVRFDGKINIESELASSIPSLQRQVTFNRGRGYGGSTALYAAADAGMMLFNDTTRSLQLVLMTDGFENASAQYKGTYATLAREVIQTARQNMISINTIDFRGRGNSLLLEALADMSGGRYYYLMKDKEIEQVFFEMQHLYNNYYEVVYKPTPVIGNRMIELVYDDGRERLASTSAIAYISDSLDIENIEERGITANITGTSYPLLTTQIPDALILFDFDRADLNAKAQQDLEQVAKYMIQNPGIKIRITGHTDLVGHDLYCIQLSNRRAKIVADYLRNKGIQESRITTEGAGKTNPVWQVEDEPRKAHENRRVEIRYVP